MLLRKLIVFAITSGLAKKAYDHFRHQRAGKAAPVHPSVHPQAAPRQPTHRRATTVSADAPQP